MLTRREFVNARASGVAASIVGATSTTEAIEAANMIVMRGFIDTHHHQYETILRGIIADSST